MEDTKNRRGFLGLLGLGGLAAALMGTGKAAQAAPKPKLFQGTSATGDMPEALKKAVAAAERSVRHPDAMVEWTLKSVAGRSGGIAGFNQITVTIEAKVS